MRRCYPPAAKPSNILFFRSTGWLLVLMRTPAWAFLKMSFSSSKPDDRKQMVKNPTNHWCEKLDWTNSSIVRITLWQAVIQKAPHISVAGQAWALVPLKLNTSISYLFLRWIYRSRRLSRRGSYSSAEWGCCLFWSTLLPLRCQRSHCPQWSLSLKDT